MSGAVQYLSIGAVEEQMEGSVRPQVPAAFNYPHQMELVCNKAFNHEIE